VPFIYGFPGYVVAVWGKWTSVAWWPDRTCMFMSGLLLSARCAVTVTWLAARVRARQRARWSSLARTAVRVG
jgi:hypothetical protein